MDRVPSLETTERLLAHTEWLTRVARALTKSADDADEVVQETWLRALARPPAHGRNLRGWLATLARNLVRSRRRSREREGARVRALARPETPTGPDDAIARAELQQVVLDAVLALAEPYRSTLVLRFLDELSAEEIAKRSGAPVETVRTRIKRGLDQVRARVAERLGGEREQLPALLAPLLSGGGAVVAAGAKVGWIVGIAAAVVVSATLVATRARHEGGVRDVATASAPAVVASDSSKALQGSKATREAEDDATTATAAAAQRPVRPTFDVVGTVVDASGAPVADVVVALLDSSSPQLRSLDAIRVVGSGIDRILEQNGNAARSALTDARGGFAITQVDGFRSWRVVASRPRRDSSEVCDVASDGSVAPVRFRLTLLKGVAIHGRVVGPDGRPVARAHVEIWASDSRTDLASRFLHNLRADTDGKFEQSPLPAAVFEFCASSDALVSTPMDRDVTGDEGAIDVTLTVRPDESSIRLHGRVVDPEGEPIVESRTFLSRLATWEREHMGSTCRVGLLAGPTPAVGAAATNSFGGNSIDSKSGDFSLVVMLEDLGDATPSSIAVVVRGRVVAVAPLAPIDMRPSASLHELGDLVVDLQALPLHPVVGAIRVHAIDAISSSPVSISRVDIRSARTRGTGASRGENLRGEGIMFAGIDPGPTLVRVRSESHVPAWREIEVVASEEPVDVTLALTPATRIVRGEVLDPAGRPVTDARVWWLEREGASWRRTPLDPAMTNGAGRFESAAVGDEGAAVQIESPSFVPATIEVAAATTSGETGELDPITLERGVKVTFRINTTASVARSVLRIATMEGECVWQDWSDDPETWVEGTRRTLTLAPGTYHYRCTVDGFAPVEAEFTASEGAEIIVTPRAR
jgi:RNA polymerase sigma-70 factor (ECF subfamily)